MMGDVRGQAERCVVIDEGVVWIGEPVHEAWSWAS